MDLLAPHSAPLSELLSLLAPDSSKNSFRLWLKQGRVLIDGEKASSFDQPVQQGQKIALGKKDKFIDGGIRILYEDRDLVVVDKLAGLLSVATAYEKETCVHSLLKARFYRQQVFPVHRLDRETSGLLVFAYSSLARDVFKHQFKTHDIQREYLAIVRGHLPVSSGTWQSYLKEEPDYFVRSAQDGQKAVTHYRVVKECKKRGLTLLYLTLETGRKNQIRVHCSEAGFPIVGDEKYGDLSPSRLCLHATNLQFSHPRTKKSMIFHSPPPAVFDRLLA